MLKSKLGLREISSFNANTLRRVHSELEFSDNLCFVSVQHAFSSSIEYYGSIGERMAAVILTRSSAKENPAVVKRLKSRFAERIFSDITSAELSNPEYAITFIKQVTKGRPFVILEYGAYFATTAHAIANDPDVGPNFLGVVEGTERRNIVFHRAPESLFWYASRIKIGRQAVEFCAAEIGKI